MSDNTHALTDVRVSGTVEAIPTWAGLLPLLLEVRERGTSAEGRKDADAELRRMAKAADTGVRLSNEPPAGMLDSASIAGAIRDAVPAGCVINGDELPEVLIAKGVRYVIESLSFAMSEADPAHDRTAFLRACGVQS